LAPADRVVVDWRISEYELVDDNEASHVDKPVTLNSALDYRANGLLSDYRVINYRTNRLTEEEDSAKTYVRCEGAHSL